MNNASYVFWWHYFHSVFCIILINFPLRISPPSLIGKISVVAVNGLAMLLGTHTLDCWGRS